MSRASDVRRERDARMAAFLAETEPVYHLPGGDGQWPTLARCGGAVRPSDTRGGFLGDVLTGDPKLLTCSACQELAR